MFWPVTIAAALLVGLLAYGVFSKGGNTTLDEAVAKGERPMAPVASLPVLGTDGSSSLADYKGKVVVLNFWASWCYPCKQEAPALAAAAKQYSGKAVVLGVDVNDFAGDARKFARKYGLRYPIVHDNHNVTSPVYGLTGLPETFFIDRSGTVVEHVPGEVKAPDIQNGVERALRSRS